MLGFSLAVSAGLCAAMASVCAKLAMASDAVAQLCIASKLKYDILDIVIPDCESIALYLRFLCFAMIFLFNAMMWTLFVKSLRKCSSSLEATLINTATNFFVSGVMGQMLFGETMSLLWWFGASLIVIGLLFVHRGTAASEESSEESAKAKSE
ncbi:transmembrane protein 42-like [Ptychodera flava]|uniref:transmembrane protein 42-like n=1 Tax=Ptychodera flava TaxID=63121 RepID=UPI00396A0599